MDYSFDFRWSFIHLPDIHVHVWKIIIRARNTCSQLKRKLFCSPPCGFMELLFNKRLEGRRQLMRARTTGLTVFNPRNDILPFLKNLLALHFPISVGGQELKEKPSDSRPSPLQTESSLEITTGPHMHSSVRQ